MITKYGKKSICGILTAIILISSAPINAHAAATYTAYEIISMIFAVVGGITIEQSQGIVGGGAFDADAIYQSMNQQQAGVGSLLSSYVNRAQYLSPGSELLISESDYQEFLEYFKTYNLQNHTTGTIDGQTATEIQQTLSSWVGWSVPALPADTVQKINNGTYNIAVRFHEWSKRDTWSLVITGSVEMSGSGQAGGYHMLICSPSYSMTGFGSAVGSWAVNQSGVAPSAYGPDYDVLQILGGTGYKADALTNGKIKNGTYDTVSKSRTWDETHGKIKGPLTLTMPATSTLSDVLERENVKDITDAINVYPVDTADNSMVYYPTQSATDFIVPEMTVETNVNVQFPAIDGEAAAYTMDLTSFFPFCIPFDIYAFMQAFEAEPEAPSITYNFPYVNNAGNVVYIQQTFSLSQFDSVAQLVRRLELIAFIVGLAFVTRSFFLRG